ncbi:hypothetical protein EMM73_16075 [Rheinheimera sediminis]|uniref:hypothetical protein n=1 Tax=Rheinheimera sp. YQF-1 TaxID=2499626 RepID=UPI000FDBEA71|nr:hypothetical protein [Rheinheimera sp. YQF-1]RVT44649.1 hypothetical protein EMM73_16075 [Rheinheimera sp. YQF-1]
MNEPTLNEILIKNAESMKPVLDAITKQSISVNKFITDLLETQKNLDYLSLENQLKSIATKIQNEDSR